MLCYSYVQGLLSGIRANILVIITQGLIIFPTKYKLYITGCAYISIYPVQVQKFHNKCYVRRSKPTIILAGVEIESVIDG